MYRLARIPVSVMNLIDLDGGVGTIAWEQLRGNNCVGKRLLENTPKGCLLLTSHNFSIVKVGNAPPRQSKNKQV
jgi:hypothetical protein